MVTLRAQGNSKCLVHALYQLFIRRTMVLCDRTRERRCLKLEPSDNIVNIS